MRSPHPLLTWTLLIVLVLTACVPATLPASQEPSPSTPSRTPSPTLTSTPQPTLGIDPASLAGTRLQVWHAFAGGAAVTFNNQVALFNSANEWDLTVETQGFGDYLSLSAAVLAGMESGELPQAVAALPEQILSWNDADQVVALSPYTNDPQYGLEPGAEADIPPIFWTIDGAGTRLGLPAQRSTRLLLYNLTWARELGLSSPPATPDEFRQQACAANAAFKADTDVANDGYGGWVVDTHWQTIYTWLLAFGGGVIEDDAYQFTSETNLSAVEFLKGLYDSNCAWLSTGDVPYEAFAGRRALFITVDLGEFPAVALALANAGSADEWTAIPFPGLSEPVTVAYGPSYSILASTPEQQLAAWLFFRWILSPENQAAWVESTGLLPLRSSVLELVGPYRAASPQWAAAQALALTAQGTPPRASWGRVRYMLADGLDFIYLTNVSVAQIPAVLEEVEAMAGEFSP